MADRSDQLAAGHRLGGFVGFLLMDLVDDQVVEEPPQLLLDDSSGCPAVGPASPVPERLCALPDDPGLAGVADLLAHLAIAVRAGDWTQAVATVPFVLEIDDLLEVASCAGLLL